MKNFRRALGQTLNRWRPIMLAAICSVIIAALWGASIGGFYPVLEVTIRGKSLQTWVAEEIASAEQELSGLQSEELETAADNATASIAMQTIDDRRKVVAAKLASYQQIQPWIENWLPQTPFGTVALVVTVLVCSTLVKHVFQIANEYLVGGVALDVTRDLRQQVFSKAIHMDRSGFRELGPAGLTATLTHHTDHLSSGIMAALGAAVREPLKAIACLVGAGIICWRLLLLSAIVAPIVGVLLVMITRKLKSSSRRVLAKARSFHEVMHESFGNINTVQSFGRESHEEGRFADTTQLMRNFGLRFVLYSALSKPVIEFLGLGMLGTTIIGGAYVVLNQQTSLFGIPISSEPLTISQLLTFFGLLIGLSDPLRKLSATYSTIYAGSVAADNLYDILDRSHRIVDPVDPKSAPSPHATLRLDSVHFGYSPDREILNDVSLEIPFGSTVAVVGHNGSGKSTLINLLCRFYDPNSGSLRFDDIDFKDMQLSDLRSRVALVNQHTELFNQSVAYNIRYGKPDATMQEVEAVAKQAHAHEFISELPEGYETAVGADGNRLSGGQRQRIALARALLCNPEILILDEATSQIDMRSEQLIRESLSEHRGQRTMIIITHREKLLELADLVLEIKNGSLLPAHDHNRSAA